MTFADNHKAASREGDTVVWGAAAIGQIINRSPRQTFYLLERGEIKCALKKGSQWAAPMAALRHEFGLTDEHQ